MPSIARMSGFLPADPRLLQVAILSTLLVLQTTVFDFGASPEQTATIAAAALATQAIASRGRFDWRSPTISAVSLSLLLRTHDPLVWVAAGVLAIGSKFVLKYNGKHLFNPSCFAIVALLPSGQVWVSPGIWGTTVWLGFLILSLGVLVVTRSDRLDTALAFLMSYGGLLVARCLFLGDPLTIPLHQMQSGALLLFGLFMITDPRTTPNDRLCRIVFAVSVASIAYWLQFGWQIREGLFYALILAAPLVPLLDKLRPSDRFLWPQPQKA